MPIARFIRSGESPEMASGALLTAAELATAIGADLATATRLLPVVTEIVNGYAPDAPAVLRKEASIRAAGYLFEQPKAARRSGETGDIRSAYATSQTGVLLHSAAKSLLYPFRSKRAGVAR